MSDLRLRVRGLGIVHGRTISAFVSARVNLGSFRF